MSARLSPAASLLRNSKLFALPPAVPLPPIAPTSDQITQSDTATSTYPTHAAIETPSIALSRGDWGFKRPLPLKSTTRTGTPSVRLPRGIDTQEHIADFESAADHVLTLRKFRELNHALRIPEEGKQSYDRRDFSVFRDSHDNTTNLSSTAPAQGYTRSLWPNLKSEDVQQQLPDHLRRKQLEIEKRRSKQGSATADPAPRAPGESSNTIREQRRWKYAGPSLIKLSEMDFELFLRSVGPEQKVKLWERAKQELIRERGETAREDGKMGEVSDSVTDEELSHYMRELRAEPKKFGPMLAELLDLPEGPIPPIRQPGAPDPWEYGRDTLAASEWREKGPPRTHPSAGLSYVHTTTISDNHPKFGPQKNKSGVLARAVRFRSRAAGASSDYGVAGFVVPRPISAGVTANIDFPELGSGGAKIPVIPGPASITEQGALKMNVTRSSEYVNKDNRAIHQIEARLEREARGEPEPDEVPSAPQFSRSRPTRRAMEVKRREVIEPSQDVDNVLAQLMEFRKSETRNSRMNKE